MLIVGCRVFRLPLMAVIGGSLKRPSDKNRLPEQQTVLVFQAACGCRQSLRDKPDKVSPRTVFSNECGQTAGAVDGCIVL